MYWTKPFKYSYGIYHNNLKIVLFRLFVWPQVRNPWSKTWVRSRSKRCWIQCVATPNAMTIFPPTTYKQDVKINSVFVFYACGELLGIFSPCCVSLCSGTSEVSSGEFLTFCLLDGQGRYLDPATRKRPTEVRPGRRSPQNGRHLTCVNVFF